MNKLLIFGSAVALALSVVSAATFDVAAYGAKGDGVAKDTAAIQKAIDAAAAAGGGTVGTVKEKARIYANKNRPFEKILFERCDINGGVEVVNADVTFKDGTLAALPLTDEQKAKINKAIEEHKTGLY